MSALPREVQKVINARASDALVALYEAVRRDEWLDIEMASQDFVEVLRDEIAAQREHSA